MKDIWTKPHHIIIEVENKNCKVLKKCASFGLSNLKVTDIRASKSGSIQHLVEIGGNQVKKIPKDDSQRILKGKNKNTYSLWFDSKGCKVCDTILSRDAFLITGKSNENQIIRYNFIVPTFRAFNNIISALKKTGHKIKILKKGKFEPKPGILTEKQEKIFWLLFNGGYFEYPRKNNLKELSHKIGISPSSLSEMIRRGTRRLLEQYFDKKPT